ncbi:MAG: TIGR02266 family protein [Myxococcales bacterium]|nr:TIGR02266 family protein [Myxococcales bacterium]
MSEGGRERRESGRAALELTVEYERLNALLSDYTHNISQGGTFIRTDRPLQVGTVLSFTIQAPRLEDGIVLRGVVRWVVEVAQSRTGRPAGMGIAFVYDSPDEKEAVNLRLDRLMAQALGPVAFEKLMGRPPPSVRAEDGSP